MLVVLFIEIFEMGGLVKIEGIVGIFPPSLFFYGKASVSLDRVSGSWTQHVPEKVLCSICFNQTKRYHFMSYKNNSVTYKIIVIIKTSYTVSYSLLCTYKAETQCVKCRLFYQLNPNIYMILKILCTPSVILFLLLTLDL